MFAIFSPPFAATFSNEAIQPPGDAFPLSCTSDERKIFILVVGITSADFGGG